jgi:RNA polymerase sigma-70 factor, ECF subfamily
LEKLDEELLKEIGYGNHQAFEALFNRHKPAVFNFALRLLGQRADAEDVTTDVFMIILNKKFEARANAKFTTWLYTVTRNAAITKIRQRKRTVTMWFVKSNTESYPTLWEPTDTANLSSEEIMIKEREEAIKKAIRNLEGRQRDALVLREYQNLSYIEISQILGVSLENVKVLIFRARENLRQQLTSLKEDFHG